MDLALFDFDGTLSTCETFPGFVHRVVPRPRLRWGGLLLAPLVMGYRLGFVPGTWVRAAIVRVGLRGLRQADVEAAGAAHAREVLPGLLRPGAMARLQWHRDRGDTVVVVSGNFELLLRPWCEAHGLQLLASGLEHHDGVLTGRYAGAQCVLAEKVRRIHAAFDLRAFGEVFAYGDTPEDEPMLALARRQVYRGIERPARAAAATA